MTRRERDYYPTPAWVANMIGPHLPDVKRWIEPCVGDGALLRAIDWGDWVAAYDLATGHDMTEPWPGEARYGLCLTNPPFSCWQQIAERSFERCEHTVLLLPISAIASKKRAEFWERHPADMHVLPKRPSFTSDGKTSAQDYAWFHWGPGAGGRWGRLGL